MQQMGKWAMERQILLILLQKASLCVQAPCYYWAQQIGYESHSCHLQYLAAAAFCCKVASSVKKITSCFRGDLGDSRHDYGTDLYSCWL